MTSKVGAVTLAPMKIVVAASWFLAFAVAGFLAIGVELDRQGRFDTGIAVIVPEFFRGDSLENLVRVAIQRGDNFQSEALARKLVERRPIPAESLSLYANALLANGKEERGAAVLQAAAGRGWRDRFVQRVVIVSALGQGTPEIAANRVMAMWRLGERGDWLADLTRATLEAPGGLSKFESRLIERDQYLGTDFLVWASASLPLATVDRLAGQMAAHHSEFDCMKFSGKIDGLVRGGRITPAKAVWDKFCTAGRHFDVNDLNFVPADIIPGPFDWRYPENAGLDVEFSQAQGSVKLHYSSSDPLLQVIARRYLALTTGRYVLKVDKAAASADTRWGVSCIRGSHPKTELRLDATVDGQLTFAVPALCIVQELTLAARSGSGDVASIKLNQLHD